MAGCAGRPGSREGGNCLCLPKFGSWLEVWRLYVLGTVNLRGMEYVLGSCSVDRFDGKQVSKQQEPR